MRPRPSGVAWNPQPAQEFESSIPLAKRTRGPRVAVLRHGKQTFQVEAGIEAGGISHHVAIMVTSLKQPKVKKSVTVVRNYDVAADAKNRISLRGARTKHFHVMVLSNGSFVLEPRVLVAPDKIPPRTLKMLETSAVSLKKGKASAPVDLSLFIGR